MELHPVEAVAPGLAARIAGAEPGRARTFAFRAARLACTVTNVQDANALAVARGGLQRYPEIDELVQLWDLERELDAACERELEAASSDLYAPSLENLQQPSECVEARAVAAVIAALSPDARDAARGATYEALAAGCDGRTLEELADQIF